MLRWLQMLEKSDQLHFNPYSLAILCAGVSALAYAFVAHKFLMLFVSAGASWLLLMIEVQRRWQPGDPTARGKRRIFKGVAAGAGFLIFVLTWYVIVALDPSLP